MKILFASPLWLLCILLLPLIFLRWWRHGKLPWLPTTYRMLPYLRVATLLALILTLSQMEIVRPLTHVTVHVVSDQSLSAGYDNERLTEQIIDALAQMKRSDDVIRYYTFGARSAFIGELKGKESSIHQPGAPVPWIDPTGTNIEAALSMVLDQIQPGGNDRILIVSDGFETIGSAESMLGVAHAKNVPIDVWLTRLSDEPEVLVERLILPESVAPNEPYDIQAVVTSTYPTLASISLYRNGHLSVRQPVQLLPERNVVSFTGLVEDETLDAITLEVRVHALLDGFEQNNVDYGVVVMETAAQILLIADDPMRGQQLTDRLTDHGLRISHIAPGEMSLGAQTLSRYRTVILLDLPAHRLSHAEHIALAEYVEKGGGGLLAIGGQNSFGLGGYKDTKLEQILPVTTDIPHDVLLPSLAMVLLIDRSGSMAETQGNFSKLDLAKEAALGVLELLHPSDLLGVIAFDGEANWVVPLQQTDNRLAIASRIAGLTAEGGTNLGAALEASIGALIPTEAAVKHLIALTDGRSTPTDFVALIDRLREAGVTVSTVGIGRDADRELLSNIAQWGAGRFYYTEDIRAIPQIFATETTVVTKPISDDTPFQPIWHQRPEFWESDDLVPRLGGYVKSTPKATAAVFLQTPDDHPVLAAYRPGLGRSAAFLSDIAGPWSGDWASWSQAGSFFGQLVRWLMRPTPADGLFAQVHTDNGWASITIDAIDDDGFFMNFLDLQADVLGPDGSIDQFSVTQQNPGRYEARFPVAMEGPYTIFVRDRGNPELTLSTGVIVPYSQEFRMIRPDTGLLNRLARDSDGIVIQGLDDEDLRPIWSHPQPASSTVPLSHLLLAFAFVCFLGDIAIRYAPQKQSDRPAVAEDDADHPIVSVGEQLQRKIQEQELAENLRRPVVPQPSTTAEIAKIAAAGRFLAQRKKPELNAAEDPDEIAD